MGLKNEFEAAVVNEPSVFEPLKFYCSSFESHNVLVKNNAFFSTRPSSLQGKT